MKLIKELTDLEILGLAGKSHMPPRYTARAIVRNEEGRYAVMYAAKFNLYSLPGGGVEEGEDLLMALRREVYEETGCICGGIKELGIVRENRGSLDYTQINSYYFVQAKRAGESHLTDSERKAGTAVQWHTLENMVHLIQNQHFDRVQGKYLVARDVAAIKEYLNILDEQPSTVDCF